MRIPTLALASLLSSALLSSLGACGGESSEEATVGDSGASAEPTKEALVAVLRDLNAALDEKDYTLAVTFMHPFPGMTPEEMAEALAGFQEKSEISADGIALLAAKGQFGPLLEIFPDRGKGFAEKAGVDAGLCHALALQDAEVAGHWDGKIFQLIRLDDVGKLR